MITFKKYLETLDEAEKNYSFQDITNAMEKLSDYNFFQNFIKKYPTMFSGPYAKDKTLFYVIAKGLKIYVIANGDLKNKNQSEELNFNSFDGENIEVLVTVYTDKKRFHYLPRTDYHAYNKEKEIDGKKYDMLEIGNRGNNYIYLNINNEGVSYNDYHKKIDNNEKIAILATKTNAYINKKLLVDIFNKNESCKELLQSIMQI